MIRILSISVGCIACTLIMTCWCQNKSYNKTNINKGTKQNISKTKNQTQLNKNNAKMKNTNKKQTKKHKTEYAYMISMI